MGKGGGSRVGWGGESRVGVGTGAGQGGVLQTMDGTAYVLGDGNPMFCFKNARFGQGHSDPREVRNHWHALDSTIKYYFVIIR